MLLVYKIYAPPSLSTQMLIKNQLLAEIALPQKIKRYMLELASVDEYILLIPYVMSLYVKSRFGESQITSLLREMEAGPPMAELSGRHGFSVP